ncbi:hypothetical protein HOC32_04780, partial [Candidatus Woesearchaeota archaeon]|nr:hypothetical protein [Candidatus Woesearchaeota archaeon]
MAKKGDKGGKKAKIKKKPSQLWKLYKVEGDKLVRLNKFSPKSPGD